MKSILLILLFVTSVFSQKKCESPDETTLGLNEISITKCTIKESKNKKNKKSRQITVRVSANKRYLKKRMSLKKTNLSKATNIESIGIDEISKQLELTKELSLKNNIENLKNKLSSEEIKKASKFSVVDELPLFKSCANKDDKKSSQLDCFNEEMIKHISKHFRYPSEAVKKSIQGNVWVRFIIDKEGTIKNVKTLGPKNANILNLEARRVVMQLPKFLPAKKEGNIVAVKYGFPISFFLED